MELNSCRPFIHFTPQYGWMNDPNGLVFHDGIYELYYQSNPDNLFWANMTWGHARSRDLLHWEQLDHVLFPDETGLMFSGSGLLSRPGDAGEERACLCFPYTAAGRDRQDASRAHFTIRMAKSYDGGNTLVKTGTKILDEVAPDNRDPKVFYHEESRAYILVLWLFGNTFGIFRSGSLEHFELSSTVELEGGFECPDLFCLPVYDGEGGRTDESRWVFWAADGSYYVGDFDGYTFTETEPRKKAYLSALPYAAQTFSNDPLGRTLSIAWLRTKTIQNQYTGAMSLPRVLTLCKTSAGHRLKLSLPEEYYRNEVPLTFEQGLAVLPTDGALRVAIRDLSAFTLSFYGDAEEPFLNISYDPSSSAFAVSALGVTDFLTISETGAPQDLELVYDRGILEITSSGDLNCTATDIPYLRSQPLKKIQLMADSTAVCAGCIGS